MNRFLLILLQLTLLSNLFAQQISVKSFQKRETDLDARVYNPKKDQNGDVCAIIKVVTTQTGFTWDPDGLGIMAAVAKVGEYWLYVPYGAKRLSIHHPKLGILRDYMYPLPIEKATVYELVLTTGKVTTTVEETIESQWLVINTEPEDAMVYLEGQFMKNGMYQTKLKPGDYTYRVELPLYYPEIGRVQITDSKKILNVKLKPASGDISVSTEPEQDAKVIVDGRMQAKTTPCKTEPLTKGEHTVQVVKEMYQPLTQKITITEGETTPLNLVLQPNYAEVSISSISNATIYINNQLKATANWQGRLSSGVYSLEARLDKHQAAKQDIEVIAGDKRSITLTPTAICGALDVLSTPPGATISIDDTTRIETTPATIQKLLIGKHTVRLQKIGYAATMDTINIAEGKTTELNLKLKEARRVTISSYPYNLDVYVDGMILGKTPQRTNLTLGNHTIRIEKNGKKAEKIISVTKKGDTNTYILSLKSAQLFEGMNLKIDSVQPPKPRIPTIFYVGGGVTYPFIQTADGKLSNSSLGYCIRLGMAKKNGIYAKLTTNLSNVTPEYTVDNLPNTYYGKPTTESSYNRFGAVGGVTLNLKPVMLYCGLGWGYFNHFVKTDIFTYANETKLKTSNIGDKNSFQGLETDTGITLGTGKGLSVSLGLSTIQLKYMEFSVGIGYSFY
ncbi:MAG: PEGA domain-containing protein [Paludibacter sp.]